MRTILFLCVLVCLSSAGAADPAANARAETFFRTVLDGDTGKAFDALMDGSLVPSNQPDAVSHLKSQLENGLRFYGRPVGYDLLEEKPFGPALVRCVYIFRLEKYPLIWEFFFYKGADCWRPIEVRFNDQLAPFKFDRPAVTADVAPTDLSPR